MHNKRSNTPNNMSSVKRSNMYWSINNMSFLKHSNMYWPINQYVIAEEQQYVLVNQYVIQNWQQYALITPIYQVQYDLQYILKRISYCPRYDKYTHSNTFRRGSNQEHVEQQHIAVVFIKEWRISIWREASEHKLFLDLLKIVLCVLTK